MARTEIILTPEEARRFSKENSELQIIFERVYSSTHDVYTVKGK